MGWPGSFCPCELSAAIFALPLLRRSYRYAQIIPAQLADVVRYRQFLPYATYILQALGHLSPVSYRPG